MITRASSNEWPARRRNKSAAAAIATAAVLAGAAGAVFSFVAHAAGAPSAARESELIHLIRQDCGACHGMTLKGGLGTPLLPETLAGKDDGALAAIILDGIHGTPMPPWRPLLSEAEVAWIVKKLKEGLP